MWYIVRLYSSRVATLDKVRSGTRVSSDDPDSSQVELYTSKNYDFTANRTLPCVATSCCRHDLNLHIINVNKYYQQ